MYRFKIVSCRISQESPQQKKALRATQGLLGWHGRVPASAKRLERQQPQHSTLPSCQTVVGCLSAGCESAPDLRVVVRPFVKPGWGYFSACTCTTLGPIQTAPLPPHTEQTRTPLHIELVIPAGFLHETQPLLAGHSPLPLQWAHVLTSPGIVDIWTSVQFVEFPLGSDKVTELHLYVQRIRYAVAKSDALMSHKTNARSKHVYHTYRFKIVSCFVSQESSTGRPQGHIRGHTITEIRPIASRLRQRADGAGVATTTRIAAAGRRR